MIYLDSAAGAKPYKEVADVIADVLTNNWGNPSSNYELGDKARMLINEVTELVANDINCKPDEIIWTSGGAESNSMAIVGVLKTHPHMHLITTHLEHTSIYETIRNNLGTPITFMKNDGQGLINLGYMNWKLREMSSRCGGNFLVTMSAANSEIGSIQDVKAISDIVHSYGGLLHIDATQLYRERPLDVQELGIDLMTTSGQKLHGPKGVGFLYVKENVRIAPIIYGSQQGGLRGGSLPTHLIAAFGKALEITRKNSAYNRVNSLRNRLLSKLTNIPNVRLNGPEVGKNRLCNNISLVVEGVNAESLVAQCSLLGIMLNKGSACQSYNPEPSKTLKAIGLSDEDAFSTIRLSLDEFITEEEVDQAAEIITKVIERMRSIDR